VANNVPSPAEFERLSRTVRELADRLAATEKELEIQFTRIADIQAELDGVRSAWGQMKPKRTAKERPPASLAKLIWNDPLSSPNLRWRLALNVPFATWDFPRVVGPRRRRTIEGASTTSHADIRWLPRLPVAEHT
jgi:hypothetical protein